MAITDISPVVVDASEKKRLMAEGYVLIIGIIAVGALAVCRFIYEPSYQEKQQAMQTALTSEHAKVCGQLGKSNGSDGQNCMKLLDGLYTTHQRAILADSSQI
jgi:hypothetical protein